MKILLIGQAPGPNTEPAHPLHPAYSQTGRQLQGLSGLSQTIFLDRFDRVNLLSEFPGRTKRDDCFPVRDARIAARAMTPFVRERRVILVGRKVATAFGYGEFDFHTWLTGEDLDHFAIVPHPSGRNPWYRTRPQLEQAEAFWNQLREELY